MEPKIQKALEGLMAEESREDVFNEVIYYLGLLNDAMFRTQNQQSIGVKLALEFVRSMKDAER